jgi:hypothetical protein
LYEKYVVMPLQKFLFNRTVNASYDHKYPNAEELQVFWWKNRVFCDMGIFGLIPFEALMDVCICRVMLPYLGRNLATARSPTTGIPPNVKYIHAFRID